MKPWILAIAVLVIYYIFTSYRNFSMMKKDKEAFEQFQSSIKEGDTILTVGGVYGKITKLEEKVVYMEIADNVIIKVDRYAIKPTR